MDGVLQGDVVALKVLGENVTAGSVIALGDTLPSANNPNVKELLLDAQVDKGEYLRVDNGTGVNEVAYDYYIALDNVDFTTNPDIVPSASNKFLKVSAYSETSKQVNDYLVFNDATQAEELNFNGSEGDVLFFEGNHFIIKSAPEIPITDPIERANFNPQDAQWKSNFQLLSHNLVEMTIGNCATNSPSGYDISTGVFAEVNLGMLKHVNGGEIKGFNIQW